MDTVYWNFVKAYTEFLREKILDPLIVTNLSGLLLHQDVGSIESDGGLIPRRSEIASNFGVPQFLGV